MQYCSDQKCIQMEQMLNFVIDAYILRNLSYQIIQ